MAPSAPQVVQRVAHPRGNGLHTPALVAAARSGSQEVAAAVQSLSLGKVVAFDFVEQGAATQSKGLGGMGAIAVMVGKGLDD